VKLLAERTAETKNAAQGRCGWSVDIAGKMAYIRTRGCCSPRCLAASRHSTEAGELPWCTRTDASVPAETSHDRARANFHAPAMRCNSARNIKREYSIGVLAQPNASVSSRTSIDRSQNPAVGDVYGQCTVVVKPSWMVAPFRGQNHSAHAGDQHRHGCAAC
jgi:hypothetical protein